MATTERTGVAFNADDKRLIEEIQKSLEVEHGKVSSAAALRYALRQTVAQIRARAEGKKA